MVSHRWSAGPPTSEPRTWRSWRAAWVDAAYGPGGFWSTQRPDDHFSTGVGVGPLVADAVARLLPPGGQVVVDVGAGDGRLLARLVDLLPRVALVGVDRRPRPAGLDPRVRWTEDHWDVDAERWAAGGPDGWTGGAGAPLVVAHEWLDDLPAPVVERGAGVWHEVEVDRAGRERRGAEVGPDDRAWLLRWWDEGRRAEVGRSRDAAWAALVRAAVRRGGRALAVDYGHVEGRRPADGTLLAYGTGRQRIPVPDGSVNLTAGVAVDALSAAGETAGATTLLLRQQSEVLARTPPAPADGLDDALEALVRRSERAALTSPGRWGDLWWLLQGADSSSDLA
ncbi:MAG: SAM-dependent methyltransferase [Janthinobacterium lividum]